MKFILNRDTLTVTDVETINSGSVNYYEADVEYDSGWDNLVVNAILIKSGETDGVQVAVINNKVFLDRDKHGRFKIGFIGYKIENGQKTFQISTNLQSFYIQKGAGGIEIEVEDVPTPTEWEIYISQIEELLKNAVVKEIDPTVPAHVKNITEQDIENWNSLDQVLQDILEAIQNGGTSSMIIEEIERLLVSYLETKTVREVEGE
jgi:hypothetical protein